jgi:hypothetical protein
MHDEIKKRIFGKPPQKITTRNLRENIAGRRGAQKVAKISLILARLCGMHVGDRSMWD